MLICATVFLTVNNANLQAILREIHSDVTKFKFKNPNAGLMERRKAVSEDLRYVARTLARQAELSQQTLRSLAESSSTVNLTDEEFRGIGGLLNQSKVILTKYGRREVTDKILIFMALIFFYSCVVYVVSKRFFSRIAY